MVKECLILLAVAIALIALAKYAQAAPCEAVTAILIGGVGR
jgi:hypothetical protein